MAKTFMQMASEAMAEVPAIPPTEAYRRIHADPNTLVIDVREVADRRATGTPAGAVPITGHYLAMRADQELPADWTDARLQDRARPVVMICGAGPLSAMGARTLKDMGFTDVSYVEGGIVAWQEAGLPTEPPSDL